MKMALLIIDLQQEFFEKGRLKKHRQKLVKNTNQLVAAAHKNKVPVIWVKQEFEKDLSDAPLYNRKNNKPITIAGTPGAEWLPELNQKKSDYFLIKKRFSAFFKTRLDVQLKKQQVNCLIIVGINTMSCVRVTAIDAYERDYEVILALDCVDAYDLEQHNNSIKYLQYAVAKGEKNNSILKIIRTHA
jgi:nicotinamidase-related amidase